MSLEEVTNVINKDKIICEILKTMFGDDEKFAGFNNIVTNLIQTGCCTTTYFSKEMDFHDAKDFIKIEKCENVDLELIKFDKNKAIKSEKFRSLISKRKAEEYERLSELFKQENISKNTLLICESLLP
jgi:hypothetical protein